MKLALLPKLILTFLFILPIVSGQGLVSTQGNVSMNTYNITLLPVLSLVSISSDGTTLTLGLNSSTLTLNSSANITLSNITNVQNSDRINFTVNTVTGIINISAITQNPNLIYHLSVEGTTNTTQTSNNTNWVFFNYSNWTQNTRNFSIFLDPSYNNVAPNLTGISLSPATRKYNRTINVSTSNDITDSESATVQLQVYRYVSGVKTYFGNTSWFAPPNNASVTVTIPWSDGLAHTIYAQAVDSGNVSGYNNLTSGEVSATFTSDITSPTVGSSSVTPSSVSTGDAVTITITADGKGANISSANVTVTRPDYTTATLALTCTYTSGDNSSCTRSYTANSGAGTYSIDSFGLTDDSGVSATPSSTLTFTASSPGSSGGGGGGGGGSTTTIIVKETENATVATPLLQLKNITTTQPELEEISRCLTESLFLANRCSGFNYGVVVEPTSWFLVFSGAFLMAGVIVVGRGIYQDEPREWVTEPLLYGTTTVLVVVVLVSSGINLYLFNLLFNSPRYAYSFFSVALWSGIVSLAWDNYYYGKKKYKIMRQP